MRAASTSARCQPKVCSFVTGRRAMRTAPRLRMSDTRSVKTCAASLRRARLWDHRPPATSAIKTMAVRATAKVSFAWVGVTPGLLSSCEWPSCVSDMRIGLLVPRTADQLALQPSCRPWLCAMSHGLCGGEPDAATASTRGAVSEAVSEAVH